MASLQHRRPGDSVDTRGFMVGLREARRIIERRDLSNREVDEAIGRRIASCEGFAEQFGASNDTWMAVHFKACAAGFAQAREDFAVEGA